MSADIMEANKREECGTRGFRVPSTSAVNGGVTGSGEKSVVERAMDDRGRSGEREGERSGAMVEQGPATARAGGDGRNETERAGETGRRGGERRQQDVKNAARGVKGGGERSVEENEMDSQSRARGVGGGADGPVMVEPVSAPVNAGEDCGSETEQGSEAQRRGGE
ncbi:hypothetical protein Q5P01_000660 [Channa striata]|uniref:Uncharacterized protein n=1 Tax=Channa striata TaxID=64152 RepID=A0AA88LES3_CHASR|nr:hypothetical protein Q5P01_000660 [Channa striata]